MTGYAVGCWWCEVRGWCYFAPMRWRLLLCAWFGHRIRTLRVISEETGAERFVTLCGRCWVMSVPTPGAFVVYYEHRSQ